MTAVKVAGELARLRDALAEQARARAEAEKRRRAAIALEEKRRNEFRDAMEHMGEVQPLAPSRSRRPRARAASARPAQPRARRARSAPRLAVGRDRRRFAARHRRRTVVLPAGIGPDVIRKLRRGEWSIQAGARPARPSGRGSTRGNRPVPARGGQARPALRAHRPRQGTRSKDRVPVLRDKVRRWLVQREDVIAFCQARPAEGGAGALVVCCGRRDKGRPSWESTERKLVTAPLPRRSFSLRPCRDAGYLAPRGWASSATLFASFPAGPCLSVLAGTARRNEPSGSALLCPPCPLAWSSPTEVALRKAPRITAQAPSGVARTAPTAFPSFRAAARISAFQAWRSLASGSE